MDVFAPESAAAPRPGLLLVHGGGWRSGDRSLLAPLAQARLLGVPFRRHHYAGAPHSFWLFQPWFDLLVQQLDLFLSTALAETAPKQEQ